METIQNKHIVILLTGSGGPAVPGMIDILRKNFKCTIIAVDMNAHSSGFYLADVGIVVPPGNDVNFLPSITKICKEYKVDVLVSVVDEELVSCLELEKLGVKVIQPEKAFVELCLDKYLLMKRMNECDLHPPQTQLASDYDIMNVSFPLVFKPRVGRGSRGVKIVDSRKELDNSIREHSDHLSEFIIQQFIDGTEFTVSVVVGRDGEVQAVIPKEIISKVGITKMARTLKNEKIDTLCRDIQNKLHANGPFNVQLRLDSKTGIPFVFEINPRFSTSTTLTVASGIDELSGLINQALYGRSAYVFGEWKDNVLMIRRNLDIFRTEGSSTFSTIQEI